MFIFPYLASKVRIGVCYLFSSLFAQLIHMTAAAASAAATTASLLLGSSRQCSRASPLRSGSAALRRARGHDHNSSVKP